MSAPRPALSLLVMAGEASACPPQLMSRLMESAARLGVSHEVLLVTSPREAAALAPLQAQGIRLVCAPDHAYGSALRAGFQAAAGEYILTLDADHEEPGACLNDLWQARSRADILIASRYMRGGRAEAPLLRLLPSRVLNAVFSRGLDLRVRDMSSGFRLYHAGVLRSLAPASAGYDLLQEILVQAMMEGYHIAEVPFTYHPRSNRSAYRRIFQFGTAYLRTFTRLWRLRNSIASADYDGRAYNALMPPQRYWQRQRYRRVTRLLARGGRCLDVGCGSSRIINALPPGSLALDILLRKLRFARAYGKPLVQGSLFHLPVAAASFPCVLCSQVIEHVPRPDALEELDRALAPGGLLILGTPDYGKWQWRVIEWFYKRLLPQAYADEHITHYQYEDLYEEFVHRRGYGLETVEYILGGELILGLRKPLP